MRRGRLNAEAPLGMLGETHSVGRRKFLDYLWWSCSKSALAPTVSPKMEPAMGHMGANPYRQDMRVPAQQTFFDLDLDLNPDF